MFTEMTPTRDDLKHYRRQEREAFDWLWRTAVAEAIFAPLFGLVVGLSSDESRTIPPAVRVLVVFGFIALALLTGVLFLRWLRRCIRHEHRLDPRGFAYKPSAILWAYFMPILNLYRPYQIIERIYAVSDPEVFPPIPPREAEAEGYRDSPRLIARAGGQQFPFPLRAWWGVRWVVYFFLRSEHGSPALNVLGLLTLVVEAILFLQIIRALQARRRERFRRWLFVLRA